MTTDNRTNEPTEAQVEAAARVYDPEAWAARDKYAADGTGTQVELDLMVEYSLGKARAALVAAQEAAPQVIRPGRQELGQTIHNRFNEARGRGGVDPWALADLILEEHPALALSSDVDEDKLAEVIRQQFEAGNIYLDSFECKIAARAVAEWLKGQG